MRTIHPNDPLCVRLHSFNRELRIRLTNACFLQTFVSGLLPRCCASAKVRHSQSPCLVYQRSCVVISATECASRTHSILNHSAPINLLYIFYHFISLCSLQSDITGFVGDHHDPFRHNKFVFATVQMH